MSANDVILNIGAANPYDVIVWVDYPPVPPSPPAPAEVRRGGGYPYTKADWPVTRRLEAERKKDKQQPKPPRRLVEPNDEADEDDIAIIIGLWLTLK